MAADNLIGQILGPGPLAEGVRLAHAPPLVAHGRFQIRSSPVARIWGLPRSGDEVPTEVRVTVEDETQVWRRSFDGQAMETRQWVANGLLIESSGLGRIAMMVSLVGSGLRYQTVKAWFGPFRMFWYPNVEADVQDAEGGWFVAVRVSWWPFGTICRYSGILIPI